jgi:hypothetical protein
MIQTMPNEGMKKLLALVDADNAVEITDSKDDYQNRNAANVGGDGGGQHVNPPPSGGDGGGMESRLAKLETQMGHVESDLGKLAGVPADIAGMKVAIDNLPTKDYLSGLLNRHFLALCAAGSAIAAVTTLILKFA